MERSDDRVLSQPCVVRFAGWESTTLRLQQAGWQLSAEQDFDGCGVRLALKFEPARLYMVARTQRYDFLRGARARPWDVAPLVFEIQHVASEIRVELIETSFAFKPFDAQPQFTSKPRRSIEDFGIFAPLLARTEEIIVEPATVAGLLDQLRKLQEPELAAIRKRNADRERREAVQQQVFHAQILSLAA